MFDFALTFQKAYCIRLAWKFIFFDIFRIVSTFENFKSIKISFVSTFGISIVDKNIAACRKRSPIGGLFRQAGCAIYNISRPFNIAYSNQEFRQRYILPEQRIRYNRHVLHFILKHMILKKKELVENMNSLKIHRIRNGKNVHKN